VCVCVCVCVCVYQAAVVIDGGYVSRVGEQSAAVQRLRAIRVLVVHLNTCVDI